MLKDNINSEDKDEDTQQEDDLAQGFAKDDKIELEDNNINNLSGEDEDDTYTSNSCKLSLSKVIIFWLFLFVEIGWSLTTNIKHKSSQK